MSVVPDPKVVNMFEVKDVDEDMVVLGKHFLQFSF